MSSTPAYCVECGAALASADRFCRSCGRAFAVPTSPPAMASAPRPSVSPAAWSPVPAPGSTILVPTASRRASLGIPKAVGRGVGAVGRGLKALARGLGGCLMVIVAFGFLGFLLNSLGDGGEPGESPRRTFAAVVPMQRLTMPPTPEPTRHVVDLAEAIAAELVDMTATGRNLAELEISLESNAEEPLTVEVAPGTLFTPASSKTQQMVVIDWVTLDVDPGETVDWLLDVACAAMEKGEPGSKDTFTLASTGASAALRKLVSSNAFQEASFRLQQFAVWTITDNPTRSGYVGLGIGGVGSGPTTAEIRTLRTMFRAAGLDPAKYRALK